MGISICKKNLARPRVSKEKICQYLEETFSRRVERNEFTPREYEKNFKNSAICSNFNLESWFECQHLATEVKTEIRLNLYRFENFKFCHLLYPEIQGPK